MWLFNFLALFVSKMGWPIIMNFRVDVYTGVVYTVTILLCTTTRATKWKKNEVIYRCFYLCIIIHYLDGWLARNFRRLTPELRFPVSIDPIKKPNSKSAWFMRKATQRRYQICPAIKHRKFQIKGRKKNMVQIR